MTEAQFRVIPPTQGASPIVAASGDVDLANVAQFQSAMNEAAEGASALTVDLTEVNYCDSAAVRALFAIAASTDLTMIVSAAGPITTLLGISGLDRVAAVVTKE